MGGMTCAACQANVSKAVSKIDGVSDVNVNLLSNSMMVEYDENRVSSEQIINAVVAVGYTAELSQKNSKKDGTTSEWEKRKQRAANDAKTLKNRLIYSVILLIPLMYFSMGHMLSLPVPEFLNNTLSSAIIQLILAFPILFINKKFFVSGFKGLIKRAPNMDSLVAIGSGASFLYSIYALLSAAYNYVNSVEPTEHHFYFESAAMILTLVTVGKYLESISKSKTTAALDKLASLAPKTAFVIRNGIEMRISTDSIVVGDTVVIRPGDTIPVDGVIIEGRGYVDQSAVTGESLPVELNAGDSVITATTNKNGSFKFRAEKIGEDTTLSQIIRLVDDASSSKAPIARIADKVSVVFVPVVITIAVLTAIIWLILGKDVSFALTSAVAVLVISCPCALGLATPVAIMVGTGKAASMGILIRNAESLEKLHSIDTVVLDKTGTITEGEPSVTDVFIADNAYSKNEILKISSSLESLSNHPYAHAIISAYKEKALYEVLDFCDHTGKGVSGKIDNDLWLCGNQKFMSENYVTLNDEILAVANEYLASGKTALYLAKNGIILALFAVSDTVRNSSTKAIKSLHDMKIRTVMLTGDNQKTANAVGKAVGVGEIVAEVMPGDKADFVNTLVTKGKKVAMIGDGINDAPALANATVGIAIGTGTDIAVETADVVLIKNSLFDAVNAIKLSSTIIKNIKMNLFWAFFYNSVGIPIAAGVFYDLLGLQLSPMLAAGAMSLSSIFVVCNALRLRKFKAIKYSEENDMEENIMKKTMVIDGMMCMHCKANVEKTLLAIDGVINVSVSLEDKTAEIELSSDIANDVFVSAIENAGYTVISCK